MTQQRRNRNGRWRGVDVLSLKDFSVDEVRVCLRGATAVGVVSPEALEEAIGLVFGGAPTLNAAVRPQVAYQRLVAWSRRTS